MAEPKKKMMTANEAGVILRESMEEAVREGWTIARWVTCSEWERICDPLGAWGVIHGYMVDDPYPLFLVMGNKAERRVFLDQAEALICGFDDRNYPEMATSKAWFNLGRRLAKEFRASNYFREMDTSEPVRIDHREVKAKAETLLSGLAQ